MIYFPIDPNLHDPECPDHTEFPEWTVGYRNVKDAFRYTGPHVEYVAGIIIPPHMYEQRYTYTVTPTRPVVIPGQHMKIFSRDGVCDDIYFVVDPPYSSWIKRNTVGYCLFSAAKRRCHRVMASRIAHFMTSFIIAYESYAIPARRTGLRDFVVDCDIPIMEYPFVQYDRRGNEMMRHRKEDES